MATLCIYKQVWCEIFSSCLKFPCVINENGFYDGREWERENEKLRIERQDANTTRLKERRLTAIQWSKFDCYFVYKFAFVSILRAKAKISMVHYLRHS